MFAFGGNASKRGKKALNRPQVKSEFRFTYTGAYTANFGPK